MTSSRCVRGDLGQGHTPTTADVGHRLRVYVHCTDKDGKTIRAMTAPSETC